MISKLRISNFALIEHLELDLNNGFTIVTGETGSGKSILLNAFSLMLGERASSSVVGNYSNKAIVEFHLVTRAKDKHFFDKFQLDFEEPTILRREVVKDGKSRVFINDTPVSLAILKEFTSDKLLIHSQYNTYELKSKQTQLELYDSLAGNTQKVEAFSTLYQKLLVQRDNYNKLVREFKKQSEDSDYSQFLFDELNKLNLDSKDYEKIEAELYKLDNIDSIKDALYQVKGFNEENGFYANIKEALKKLDKIDSPGSELEDITRRLTEVSIELKELSNDSESIIDALVDDPEKREELLTSLDEYNRMLQKHKVGSQQELKSIRDGLSDNSLSLIDLDSKIKQMSRSLKETEDAVQNLAESLHKNRVEAQENLSERIVKELKSLKLPHTKIHFKMEKGSLNEMGITELNLLFSANLGHPQIEIEKAASGGELSRFMLALLKLISESRKMPTILFDEIDSGVSGDVAQKIGQLLKNMGIKTQLLVISHLPQVASKAQHHLMVHKDIIENKTITSVDVLDMDKRVLEVARLMSGENVTQSALDTAKSLMT
ncbi:DNA repair protein RecN [Crocinitomicaceae bacterium]|jgi:DNA repair protein RecN (Recombination protein N)|nr:DNA repair protein RecN [Crocinitomicaceae bacterium]MDC0297238.1 DNA repair protein RecN [Crocinitomicaceae bacterium]